MIKIKNSLLALLLLLMIALKAQASADPDASKGEALIKAMSQRLASAQHFSFNTSESHDVVDRAGKKVKITLTREMLVRRPDGFWAKYKGDRDWEFWYDGKLLTGISTEKKAYIQHETPPTLDATMDMLVQRFNMDLPISDLLYSSPYDALIDDQTHGGFAGSETIEGVSCSHLIYTAPAVDWQLWINEKTSLPCKLEMTYKMKPGPPIYRVTFSHWNLSPKITQDSFANKIPEGFVRVPMLERVLLEKGNATQTQTAPANQ